MHQDFGCGDPLFTPMKVFLNLLTVFAKNSTGYNKKQSIFSPSEKTEVMAVVEDAVKRIAPRTKVRCMCIALCTVHCAATFDFDSCILNSHNGQWARSKVRVEEFLC